MGTRFCRFPIPFSSFILVKNIYRFLLLSGFLGLLAPVRAQAQTNFRQGYVLPLAGDTLRGEVDSRDGRTSAQRCRFRTTAQSVVVTYLPAELRGYGLTVDNQHYRALTVAAAPQPYFLEVLVDGPAALYFLRDAQQREFYYVVSPQLPLAPLEHAFVRMVRDGRTYSEEQAPYRNTLVVALAGCPAAQAQLPRLPFQESALRRVVAAYNHCQGYQAPRALPAASATHASLGIVAGVVQHNLAYTGFPYDPSFAKAAHHVGYAVGPMAHFYLTRLSQKLSVTVALLYEPEKFVLEAYNTSAGAQSGSIRSRFDLAYLRLPLMFRYTYPRGRFAPLVEAGFTAAYAIKGNNMFELVYPGGQTSLPQTLLVGNAFRPLELGLGAGLGLSTRAANGRAIALLARAELSNGFSNAIEAGATVLRFYGLVSYDLTKAPGPGSH